MQEAESVADVQSGRPVIAVAAVDFGWGSFGKLRLILDELPGMDIALVAGAHTASIIGRLLGSNYPAAVTAPMDAVLGLVINDPTAADRLVAERLPVVYIDSLPYLWRVPEEVPKSVDIYCAQSIPGGEPAADGPLAGRDDLVWVEPIVPPPAPREATQGVVVNVGGMHSHLSGRAADSYVTLVLLPLIELLVAKARRVSAVCGNIPDWAAAELRQMLPEATVGIQRGSDFEFLVRSADILFTSPGSTTLLQAVTARVRTIALPPQNLSQILNADLFRAYTEATVAWPTSVLDLRVVELNRSLGENSALEHIYGAQIRAADSSEVCLEVRSTLAEIVRALPSNDGSSTGPMLRTGGAKQVADQITGLLADSGGRS